MSKGTRPHFDIASDIELSVAMLEEIDKLIDILDEAMESAYQSEEHFDNYKAINFAKRLPMRLALVRVIQRELRIRIEELGKASQRLLEIS